MSFVSFSLNTEIFLKYGLTGQTAETDIMEVLRRQEKLTIKLIMTGQIHIRLYGSCSLKLLCSVMPDPMYDGLEMKVEWAVLQTGVCLKRMICIREAILQKSWEKVMKMVIIGCQLK